MDFLVVFVLFAGTAALFYRLGYVKGRQEDEHIEYLRGYDAGYADRDNLSS